MTEERPSHETRPGVATPLEATDQPDEVACQGGMLTSCSCCQMSRGPGESHASHLPIKLDCKRRPDGIEASFGIGSLVLDDRTERQGGEGVPHHELQPG